MSPEAADPECPLFRRYRRKSGRDTSFAFRSRLTHYGHQPASDVAVAKSVAANNESGVLRRDISGTGAATGMARLCKRQQQAAIFLLGPHPQGAHG